MSIESKFEEYQQSLLDILKKIDEIKSYWGMIERDNFNDCHVSTCSMIKMVYEQIRFRDICSAKQKLDELLKMDINEEVIPKLENFYNQVNQQIFGEIYEIYQSSNSFACNSKGFRRRNNIVNNSCGTICGRRYKH